MPLKISLKRNKLSDKTDNELLVLFNHNNDNQIIGELYNRYNHIIFGVCIKYLKDTELARDAMLHLFSQLFELLKRYQVNDFKNWMLTITRNHCLREIKLNSRLVPYALCAEKETAVDFMENEDQIDHIYARESMLLYLDNALKQLKPQQKQCIELFYLQNKSYVEITQTTGFELKKVKSYIQNGKRNLQIIIDELKKQKNE